MMNAADALEVFAAMSIGIAGFSAIVVALVANKIIYDERRLNWGLGIVFCWSLGASFFSVLPFILFYFGMAERVVWRSGLLVMGTYVTIAGAIVLSVDRRLNQVGLDIRGIQREAPIKRSREMVLAQAIYLVIAVTLVIAGAGLPIPARSKT